MKSPIVTVSLCALVGLTSYYFGAKNVHEEQIAAMENARFVNDLHRVTIYHETLKKLETGQYEASIDQINQWLTTDMQQISGYKAQLGKQDQAQVDMMFNNIAEHRAQQQITNQQVSLLTE